MKQIKGKVFFEEDNFVEGVTATLTIEGDKYELEFVENNYRAKNYKLIHGEFLDLGYVTFINCIHIGYTLGTVSVNKYKPYHFITEVKFNSREDIVASSLNVTMPLLKKIFRKSNLIGDLFFEKKLEYITPEKIKIYESQECLIHINFYLSVNHNFFEEISIKEYCSLEIETVNVSIDIFELLDIYKKIKLFFGFLGFFSKEEDTYWFKESNLNYDNQVEPIVMKFYSSNFNIENKGLTPHKTFNFEDIKNDLQNILSNWFKNENIQDSIVLVMEKYTFIKLSVETYFLNTCFAIETFHRKNKFNEVYEKAKFDFIKKGIRSKLETQEEIDLFNDKLIYANEPTFKSRLLSLKTEFGYIANESLDIDEYIIKIVSTRNYLVHRGKKKNIFEGIHLYYAAVYLETLTKYCIMETIGVNSEVLKNSFAGTSKYINELYDLNASSKFI